MNAGLIAPSTFLEELEDVRIDAQVDGLLGDRKLHFRIVPEVGGQLDWCRIRTRGADLALLFHGSQFLKGRFPDISHVPSRLLSMLI